MDIEIEYYIPKECNEALPLINDNLSYTKGQNELLIDKSSLTKIVDVNIVDGKAYLKAVVLLRKMWDKGYENEQRMTKLYIWFIKKNNLTTRILVVLLLFYLQLNVG